MNLIISLLLILMVAAVVLWAIRSILPLLGLPEPVGTILYVLVVLIVVLVIVQSLGGIAWPVAHIR